MFFGETAINLDAKGRFAVPTRYRELIQEQCGGRMVLTYSAYDSGALWLSPQEYWERMRDQVMELGTFNSAHRSLQRRLRLPALRAQGLQLGPPLLQLPALRALLGTLISLTPGTMTVEIESSLEVPFVFTTAE